LLYEYIRKRPEKSMCEDNEDKRERNTKEGDGERRERDGGIDSKTQNQGDSKRWFVQRKGKK
jgi:hypothetical protein